MATRVASTDTGYVTGQLSNFPGALDTQYQLYTATNNSQTVLAQSLTYAGTYVVVDDASGFPNKGIIRIGPAPGQSGMAEMVYYGSKTATSFTNLIRGFAGSRQNPWPIGSYVSNGVFAEYHNAIKDAIIQIEENLGINYLPVPTSLNGILSAQEIRFLAPVPLFRAFPFQGPPPLQVRFQNFSTGPLVKYLWTFGDGTTSIERSPTHTYLKEGIYSVSLNVITSLGAQGIVTKSNYITASEQARQPFFYVTPLQGYSRQTAAALTASGHPTTPTIFNFVDQTDGDIVQRYWVFDGPGTNNNVQVTTQTIAEYDPNVHTTSYVYDAPGVYMPTLLILFENQNIKRAFLSNQITVN